MGQLTALQIKNAKPGRYADGHGLYLLVKPTGTKSWILRVQVEGRRRDYGLGPLHLLSLSEAREKALDGLKLAKAGLDPSVEWKRSTRSVPTFEEAARRYHDQTLQGWKNPKHGAQWLATMEKYAFPFIGNLRVDRTDAGDIAAALIPIWLEVPETARRVRQRIATVLNNARAQGWRSTEAPMHAVKSLLGGLRQPKKGNFPAMPYHLLPLFMQKLVDQDSSTGRLALRFLILTAARSGEVRGATFAEVDPAQLQWNVPAERMKSREPHSVPLSATAMRIVEEASRFGAASRNGLLFPGLRGKPMSDMTLAKAFKAAGGEGYTVHGLRSSFRDWAAEQTSYPGEIAEAALAHTQANRVEAAYRRTKYLEQRRKLMADWETFLLSARSKAARFPHEAKKS
jgi:integrase